MPAFVGTSGWMYRDWRGTFYPEDVPQRLWLEFYGEQFSTVELNNAFYRLPSHDQFVAWKDRLPAGFVVAVKASRYLTHIKRLREPAEPVGRLLEHAEGLGTRLGPVLLQLPPNLPADLDRLDECLAAFPPNVRVAVEPRHPSWWVDDVKRVLERHGAALCWADWRATTPMPLWRTATWGYVRLHEGRATPWPHYGDQALASWAQRLADKFTADEDAYMYFNNDPGGAATENARTLIDALRERGLVVPRR